MALKVNGFIGSSMLVLAFTTLSPTPQCYAQEAGKGGGTVSTNAADIARAQIKSLEEGINQGDADVSVALGRLIKLYQQQGMTNRLIETCSKVVAEKKDPESVTFAASALSAFYAQNLNYNDAAKVLEGILAKAGGSEWKASRLVVVKLLVPIYVTNLGRNLDASVVLEDEINRCATNDVATKSDLLNRKAQILQTSLADTAGAVNCCQAILAMGPSVPPAIIDVTRNRLISLYLAVGDRERSIEIVQQFIQESSTSAVVAAYVKKLTDSGASPAQCGMAADSLRAKILASKATVSTVESLHPLLVNLLIRQGRIDEALQEARVLYNLSSDKGFPQAVDTVAQTFKAADSGLARANRFLKFQKCGVAGEDGKIGTLDDLHDPLSDIPALRDEKRVQAMRDAMISLPLDSAGYRRRAEMHLFVDQHSEAFLALQKSLELCAMTTNELQSATDALTGLVVRRTKDVSLATQLVEFIMFGSFGKDGRVGTSDDLKNPVPVILERLQYAQVQPNASQTAVSGSVTPPVADKISAPAVTPGG